MKELFPEKCLKVYRKNLAQNGIVVALPAAGKKYLPYFTRTTWNNLFPDKCYICCADPSLLEYSESLNATWFLDKSKGSRLNEFACWLEKFVEENVGDKEKAKIIFSGSSMGGYASIYLANLIEGSFAFAECPQTNLYKYPGSNKAIQHIAGNNDSCLHEHINLINVFKRLGRVPNAHIFIPASDFHHLNQHVVPYIKAVSKFLKEEKSENTYFKVSVEHSSSTPFGHAPISKHQFKDSIEQLFYEMNSVAMIPKSKIRRVINKYFRP